MKTIPIFIVFENEGFQKLKAAHQFFVLNAAYRLCREDKECEPIPRNLRYYLRCSESTYFRHSEVFRAILIEVIPKIAEFKLTKYKQVRKAHAANVKRGIKHKKMQNRESQHFDEQSTHTEIIPVISPREKWNAGMHDHVLVEKAKDNNNKAVKTMFKDK